MLTALAVAEAAYSTAFRGGLGVGALVRACRVLRRIVSWGRVKSGDAGMEGRGGVTGHSTVLKRETRHLCLLHAAGQEEGVAAVAMRRVSPRRRARSPRRADVGAGERPRSL